ncbi:Clp protease N-terminal domain-containing protein [Demequina sp. NBRC 110051]|uniref:Clp protease N-terminal domain-containing protein n=1 Tax=Demequina sp. NBRC 110051 TaxID=1570340 RepID=UPI000A02BC29|nr:Clp protease N-terminal domain-containing protein [Demequina sp. NBRC 110051]
MFDRFTEAAREGLVSAQQLAAHLGRGQIDADALVVGMTVRSTSVAARAFEACGVSRPALLEALGLSVDAAPHTHTEHLPFAKEAKVALERSLTEVFATGADDLATGHVLAAALREPGPHVVGVLAGTGTDMTAVRAAVFAVFADGPAAITPEGPHPFASPRKARAFRRMAAQRSSESRRRFGLGF